MGTGQGMTKKEAEQRAARMALEDLDGEIISKRED
jgi:dsRNA-specific ribonuclease